MTKPIIQVENIFKEFKVGKNHVKVLKGISLDIFPGEFVLIYGHSGCGKSTLLNTITGLEKPTSGKIRINGNDLYLLSEDSRARFRQKNFGMVSQHPEWIKSLNVIENVAYPLMISGANHRKAVLRAKQSLDLLGLSEYAWMKYNRNISPNTMSSGQQQKVSMCRAFAANSYILVADEPTGNLDSESGREVMDIFKNINEDSGRTIIMVSHNIDYEKYASKLIYMKDGIIEKVITKSQPSKCTDKKCDDLLVTALGRSV